MNPFTLSVEGRSKGKRIFKREKSDESLEELFGSDAMVGFWRECKDYVDCKYRFYFEAVTGSLLGGFATCDLSCDPESYAYIGSRGMPTRRYLREIHGLSEERIDEIIDRMIEFIRSGHARVISIFDDPIGGGGLPLIYVKEVQDLVPIYAP